MIARHWKGIAKPAEAENYVNHLHNDTFPKLAALKGFVRATILKRHISKGIEFLIITWWELMEAIQQFAGENVHTAVVPPVAQAMMVEYDKEVSHYEVAESYPST